MDLTTVPIESFKAEITFVIFISWVSALFMLFIVGIAFIEYLFKSIDWIKLYVKEKIKRKYKQK